MDREILVRDHPTLSVVRGLPDDTWGIFRIPETAGIMAGVKAAFDEASRFFKTDLSGLELLEFNGIRVFEARTTKDLPLPYYTVALRRKESRG